MGTFLIGLILLIIVYIIASSSEKNNKIKVQDAELCNLSHYGTCKYSFYSKNGQQYLLVTGDNKIVFVDNYNKKTEINLNDIMKVDLKYHVVERHKQKVLTVVPSFDKTTALSKLELNIFTYSDNDINYIFNPICYPEDLVNKLEKFKYLIDDIKSKNTN